MDQKSFHVEAAAVALIHAVMVTLEKDFQFTDFQKKQFKQCFTSHLERTRANLNLELKKAGWTG